MELIPRGCVKNTIVSIDDEPFAYVAESLEEDRQLTALETGETNQTVTVIEEWTGNSMIRYIPHSDGTRTVLEQSTRPRPFHTIGSGPTWKHYQEISSQIEQN